jgi:hypothetical protein
MSFFTRMRLSGQKQGGSFKDIQEAIEGILEVRRELNNPIPPPEISLVEVAA